MAAAAANADYPDDNEFDDYNPHPYAGGYDITATYGSPLPPSPATCHPVASPAATPAPTAPQPVPRPPRPQPPAPAPAPAPAPQPPKPSSPPAPAPAPTAEPYYWPKPYDYGDAPRHQPLYPTPEVFRGWPFLPPPPAPHCRCRSACAHHRDYWRQCMRGLDYLFGHCDGYGERRIEVDSLGVPVYANRKGGVEDAVVVEVAPPATGTVQWHDTGEEQFQSNRSSCYGHAQEEAHSYEQPTYTSYDRSYEQPTYTSSYDRSYGQPNYTSYDRSYEQTAYTSYGQSNEQPYSFHGVPDETTWFPNQSYQEVYGEEESQSQEVYREEESQYQEFLSYDEDSKISSQPIFSYNQHFGEQPLHIHVEPPETVSSHKLEYYENFLTYNSQNDVDNLESSRQSYEIQPYVDIPYDQLEPYRPSWSLNSGYYQACTEGITPEYDNHTLASDECWDMSSLFMSPFYPQEARSYEQSHGDENV
ncbi:uncharacterized protein At5g39570-like isoform X2 [Miscanthus floridulus]|uniref:uncharacterized protein At5g39570-like isoform X2 n=1 Tax=Miscanthus floridulus TaxID=154761 RepID=UPI003459ABD2